MRIYRLYRWVYEGKSESVLNSTDAYSVLREKKKGRIEANDPQYTGDNFVTVLEYIGDRVVENRDGIAHLLYGKGAKLPPAWSP